MSQRPERGLLDTSVLIAGESGRALAESLLPDQLVISAVTVAELQVGVLAATSVAIRARRLATLEAVTDVETLPIDTAVASAWAALRVGLAEMGRRADVNDLWIAATASAHGLPVVTQDDDFEPIGAVARLEIIRV